MGYLWTKYLKLRFLGLVPLVTRSVEKVALKKSKARVQNAVNETVFSFVETDVKRSD